MKIRLALLFTVLLLAILSSRSLVVVWQTNVAGLALVPDLIKVDSDIYPPRCNRWIDEPRAEEWVKKVADAEPENPQALINLGRVAWLTGECDESLNLARCFG